MTRYERIKSMSIEEMAEAMIGLGGTDDYCESDCEDPYFECTHEKECCIRWLNESEGK